METIGKEEGGEESWRRGKEGDEELEISDLIEPEGPVFRRKGRNQWKQRPERGNERKNWVRSERLKGRIPDETGYWYVWELVWVW
jgi:hypothetical protein